MDKRWIEDAVVSTMSTATAIIIIINFVAGACHCPLRLRLSPWRGRQLIFMRSQNVCVCVCEVDAIWALLLSSVIWMCERARDIFAIIQTDRPCWFRCLLYHRNSFIFPTLRVQSTYFLFYFWFSAARWQFSPWLHAFPFRSDKYTNE